MADIIDIIKRSSELDIFANAIQITDLDRALNREEIFTVFAPINSAFTGLSKSILHRLSVDTSLLTEVMHLHIVRGRFDREELLRSDDRRQHQLRYMAIDGSRHQIDLRDRMRMAAAKICSTDLSASNGIIYKIDRVMLAPEFEQILLPS